MSTSGAAKETTALPRRPLYLWPDVGTAVRAEDRSLAAYQKRVPIARFPVSRISRIVATNRVDWHGGALRLCLSEGVGIVFLDGHGTCLGSLEPALARVSPLDELLEELVAAPRGMHIYDNFLRHIRSCALRNWAASREPIRPLTSGERSAWMRIYVYRGEPPVHLAFNCRGLLQSIVNASLRAAGIRTRYWRNSAEVLDLGADITAVIYGRVVMEAGTLLLQETHPPSAVRLFEAAARRYQSYIDDTLERLKLLLLRFKR